MSKLKTKKGILAICILTMLSVAIAYSQLMTYYEIQNTLTIKGVKVLIFKWIDDATTPTELKSAHDWNKMSSEQIAHTENIVVHNEGSEPLTLEFTNTLPTNVGNIVFEIEVYESGEGWTFKPWGTGETVAGSNKYYEGTPDNPLDAGEYVGMRQSSPTNGDLGNVRVTITIALDPPTGVVAPFTTTVTGTEYII